MRGLKMKKRKSKDTGIELDIVNNPKRADIIKTIESSGEFRVEESDGKVTLYYLASEGNPLVNRRKRKTKKVHLLPFWRVGAPSPNEGRGLVETVAKLQDIALANDETYGAIYSGIIAAPAKKNKFIIP